MLGYLDTGFEFDTSGLVNIVLGALGDRLSYNGMDEYLKIYIDDSAEDVVKIKFDCTVKEDGDTESFIATWVFENGALAGCKLEIKEYYNYGDGDYDSTTYTATVRKTNKKVVLPKDLHTYIDDGSLCDIFGGGGVSKI